MADTGWQFGSLEQVWISQDAAWSGPGNLHADDATVASVTTLQPGQSSDYLHLYGYGFSIDSSATIDGIEVEYGDYENNSGVFTWSNVRITDTSGLPWGSDYSSLMDAPGSTPKTDIAGGPTNLWGVTPSPSDVNNTNFGTIIRLSAPNSSSFLMDYVRIKVYYTIAPAITDVDTDETWNDGDTGLVITGTKLY